MAYDQETLNAAKEWFQDLKKALQAKGVDLNDPLALSRIQIRNLYSEELMQAGRNLDNQNSGTIAAELDRFTKPTFAYAFAECTEDSHENAVTGIDDDPVEWVNSHIKTMDAIENDPDHLVHLYTMAKENRLYLRDAGFDNIAEAQFHYIRVLDEPVVQHDEKAIYDSIATDDQKHYFRKAGAPVFEGKAGITREINNALIFDKEVENHIKAELSRKYPDKFDEIYDKNKMFPEAAELMKGKTISDFDHYAPGEYEKMTDLDTNYSQGVRRASAIYNDCLHEALVDEFHDLGDNEAEKEAIRNELRPVAKRYTKEAGNTLMLEMYAAYPDYLSVKENRSKLQNVINAKFMDPYLRTEEEKDLLKQYPIISDATAVLQSFFNKNAKGMSVKQLMESGRITKADNTPFSSDDTFTFMNELCGSVKRGFRFTYVEPDGTKHNDLVCSYASGPIAPVISVRSYRQRYSKLISELNATNGNWTKNSDSYEELRSTIAGLDQTINSRKLLNFVPSERPDEIDRRQFGDAMSSIKEHCKAYMTEHQTTRSLSSRQKSRLKIINELYRLAEQFEQAVQDPLFEKKDILTERIANMMAIKALDSENMNTRLNIPMRQYGKECLTDPARRRDLLKVVNRYGVPEAMLSGVTPKEQDDLLAKDDKELYQQFLKLDKEAMTKSKEARAKKKEEKLKQIDQPVINQNGPHL